MADCRIPYRCSSGNPGSNGPSGHTGNRHNWEATVGQMSSEAWASFQTILLLSGCCISVLHCTGHQKTHSRILKRARAGTHCDIFSCVSSQFCVCALKIAAIAAASSSFTTADVTGAVCSIELLGFLSSQRVNGGVLVPQASKAKPRLSHRTSST